MVRRTSNRDLPTWDDAPDLNRLVCDKRSGKRATPAKGRRRNRRYENRLLKTHLADPLEEFDQAEAAWNAAWNNGKNSSNVDLEHDLDNNFDRDGQNRG